MDVGLDYIRGGFDPVAQCLAAGIEEDLAVARLERPDDVAINRRIHARRQASRNDKPFAIQLRESLMEQVHIRRRRSEAGEVDVGCLLLNSVGDFDSDPGLTGNADEVIFDFFARKTGFERRAVFPPRKPVTATRWP